MSLVFLIVAAGRGIRAGGNIPKQYRDLCGKPVLQHCIENLLRFDGSARIAVVISPQDRARFEAISNDIGDERVLRAVLGGDQRRDSVRNGLESLSNTPPDKVLIHDAARPFTPDLVLHRVVDALNDYEAAFPTLDIVDALWSTREGLVTHPVSRDNLVRAQTPQGFDFASILNAHRDYDGDAPDDVTVAHQAGLRIKSVAGSEKNFKITLPSDFEKAERILQNPMFRFGNGYDVHAFETGDHVVLCGIKIPHDQALKGHSDADVAMHAITDAIYGALAEGDIGRHFPPSDPEWKGAASEIFLNHANDLAADRGYRINQIDCTLICETPKITPYADQMRRNIAHIIRADISDISVKATTSEGLGFTGRKEGIAAMATVSLVQK